ncbi:MAG TPA: hypothetical protein VF585_02720 [Chthoniobacterales bacterium]|jgi:hypothetical protein
MELNRWTQQLHSLYDTAVGKYRSGIRGAENFFNEDEITFLASIGLKPINLYDYAEDFVGGGEPDWDTVLLMVAARRDYFTHEMQGQWSATPISETDLPAKTEAHAGIEWLPRIVPKAVAYLKGALPPQIMYCCGGDRKFFRNNGVHPADFLRVVWATHGDIDKLAEYIRKS